MPTHLTIAIASDVHLLDGPGRFSGADVALFPEIAFGGYARLAREPLAAREVALEVARFRAFSVATSCTVVAGSIALPGPRRSATNTSLVFSHGRRIHRYDKIHLFRPCNDHRYFSPGRNARTFLFPGPDGGRIRGGVVICFDLRFPELMRLLALQGMQILFVPARWPRIRDDAWRTLLKARAIENQIFVAGCNALGEEGGRSYVFDPMGEELLSTGGDPDAPFHLVRIDLEQIVRARLLHKNIDEAVLLRKRVVRRKR